MNGQEGSPSVLECEPAWDAWHRILNLCGRGDTLDWLPLYTQTVKRYPSSVRYPGQLLLDIYSWYTDPANRQMRVLKEIKRHSASGIPWAMCKMGSAFYHGIGVPRNWSEAYWWFARAADADQAEAQCRLAGLIRTSEPPLNDMEQAAALYLTVAVKPYSAWNREARASAAEIYAFGMGVPEDRHIARHLIEPMLRPDVRSNPEWPTVERVARRVDLLPA